MSPYIHQGAPLSKRYPTCFGVPNRFLNDPSIQAKQYGLFGIQ